MNFLKPILFLCVFAPACGWGFTNNVMAPLAVGDLWHPQDKAYDSAWAQFDDQLQHMKDIGVYAVSTDVWWGVIEAQDDQFHWEYYDKLSDHIRAAGLKWVPILSFHACGGNVGDSVNVPIPHWIWTKHLGKSKAVQTADDLKYKSEQMHVSSEYVSAWGTPLVSEDYRDVMSAFQKHFAAKKDMISEINISLGPAGELRYPSYNSHDQGSGYPTRGALQAYSNLAIESWRAFVTDKYHSVENLNKAWHSQLASFDQVYPPSDQGGAPNAFFKNSQHRSAYGRDFFDWYNQALVRHGQTVLALASSVFDSTQSAFQGVDIGAKVPGVHWRMAGDRLAELAAGLITSGQDSNFTKLPDGITPLTIGYDRIVSVFGPQKSPTSNIVMHFTCLEKDNLEDQGNGADSLAKTLVFEIGKEALRQGVTLKGENALSGPLSGQRAWDNMADAAQWSSYQGLTILRIGEMDEGAIQHYRQFITFSHRLNK